MLALHEALASITSSTWKFTSIGMKHWWHSETHADASPNLDEVLALTMKKLYRRARRRNGTSSTSFLEGLKESSNDPLGISYDQIQKKSTCTRRIGMRRSHESSACLLRGFGESVASETCRKHRHRHSRDRFHRASVFLAAQPQPFQTQHDIEPEIQAYSGPRGTEEFDPMKQKTPEKCSQHCVESPGMECLRCNPDGSVENEIQKMQRLARDAAMRSGDPDAADIEAWKQRSLNSQYPLCDGSRLRTVTHCRIPPPVYEKGTADISAYK
ncbi:unnamed protein product [Amoebophrya sp. A25]|nr:unnamed protein product [Amoebophrya sp. A25]|eukprot:GSA25T00013510001.1